MANVLPRELPAASSVSSVVAIIIDNGSTVEKATPVQVVAAGFPVASQAEAEAGIVNNKAMTPIRVAQAIAALGLSGAVLAGTTGASLIGLSGGGTVQDFVDAVGGANATDVAATSYSLTDADNGKLLRFTAATSVAVTVPAGLTDNFICSILQLGLGQVTIAGSGATVENKDSQFSTQARLARLTLYTTGADQYNLEGQTA